MDFRSSGTLEKEIISILKDELSFYQSMFILADKQKDCLKLDQDGELTKVFADIARFNRRISESEKKLRNLMEKDRQGFSLTLSNLEVRRLVDSIAAILQKNVALMKENEEFVANRQAAIQTELAELSKSRQMMDTLAAVKRASPLVNREK